MGKWTIGTVNYRSEIYLPWKLKMCYEFEDKEDFKYIIVDNEPIHNKSFFDNLKLQYPEIKVIPFDPTPFVPVSSYSTLFWGNQSSGYHAAALNIILLEARKSGSEYLMIYDPDFFWIQKNTLKYFESEFKKHDYCAIGAPYDYITSIGNTTFPCVFGSAYRVKDLDGVDFSSGFFEEINEGKDTGWKIREKLSYKKFLSFNTEAIPENEIIKVNGDVSKRWGWSDHQQYKIDDNKIAYHLYRGSQGCWGTTAEKYCQKYYKELTQSRGFCDK